jgi:serine-type D-Ala-D-Ala carboxypeptidase
MPIRVRLPIAVLAALTLAATSALASPDQPARGRGHDDSPAGRFDRPQDGFAAQWTRLREGNPRDVGLDPAPIGQALSRIRSWTEPSGGNHPMFAGAVTLLVHDGAVVTRQASGYALRYADGAELPPQDRVPAQTDTIFDLASVSKLFTSIAVLQQVEAGRVELTKPVASYLPEFATNGKESITVQQLLTHTSGLPPWLPLWRDWPDKPSRILATLRVKPQAPAGTSYLYSDLNMITLGVLVERVTGSTLDTVVREDITEPLGMHDTGYNPPASVRDRVAATEYQLNPPRGMVRGEVHDENAWSLGGVAGHAGVFSTADDLAVLSQAILCGGSYLGKRILRPATVESMLTNYNTSFPDDAHGLGFELDQRWYMGGLAAAHTAGHTGYTGTSLVIDPASRSIAVLLTNRVHPSRGWGSNNPARRAVAAGLAQSLAVVPPHAETEWFAGVGNERTATLTTRPLRSHGAGPPGSARATFDAFVDTDPADALTVESSVDAGVTWQPVALHAQGRGAPDNAVKSMSAYGHRSWWRVRADVPATGNVLLRWRYTTGNQFSGRGVYVSDIVIRDSGGVLVDGDPEALVASGWLLVTH